ncbi:hypothetical protein EW145_g2443 [Phellinidium pouzarii]|uniref:SUI1 domain-containing protein n=1 Tax=Phellinidium pouzarii TaxID=167371 RepID=A0A4S4LCT7_9AGAM|nr:hypothetical protein EW145_g2443 [Phellinidium pouzarii]
MFRKPLNDLKTSAPLRNSDRRKLKQRVLQDFGLSEAQSELGDLIVPEGLQSVKFTTHSGEPGVAYLSSDGEPLWFSLGKGSGDLIPTVYTLWKYPRLLPFLSTPSAVIPVLTGGADLMIAGVVEHNSGLAPGQVVAVTCYTQDALGPPLVVGRMAVADSQLVREDGTAKGKAVHILHTIKDKLWEMGGQRDPPEPVPHEDNGYATERKEEASFTPAENATPLQSKIEELIVDEQVSSILRTALLQAILTSLAVLPPASFPLPSTVFYTSHILPARPAHTPSSTPIDIKHSAHKNLTAFLRAAEKEGLVRLKEARGKAGGDAQVLGVVIDHPDVNAHRVYRTVGEADAKRERREERAAAEASRTREIVVTELWKPHQQSIRFFEETEKGSSSLYTLQEIKTILNEYITAKSLVNTHQAQFINMDDLLSGMLATKGSDVPDFMKRDELTRSLLDKMQPWHRIEADGKDPLVKKGKLAPISVIVKLRQGRKACTLITNFEPFLLAADALADELRRTCASSTAVVPLPGKNAGFEVMVQGKQIKAVADMLQAKGVPKKWIESEDMTEKKKK